MSADSQVSQVRNPGTLEGNQATEGYALYTHARHDKAVAQQLTGRSFPDGANKMRRTPGNRTLNFHLVQRPNAKPVSNLTKRAMDIIGSVLALLLSAPVLLAIALAIRLTSKGPVFFRQKRIGQSGEEFVFLKFRTMHVNNDPRVHQEYVRQLISGSAQRHPEGGEGKGVYKLTRDSRITRVGRLLRRTSLDELPQLLNVLRGEMSLVGPRPALAYEVEAYDIWHRQRIVEAKPGITGLWQVNGRSRVTFDDMVRMDLQYARTWSPWMDLKILMRTPVAMFFGGGAY
jgi:exopolysaccharide biosynthesis polyprenyl glycosylphosphotransferase